MKTVEPSTATPSSSLPGESFSRTNSPKVLPGHLEKLAIVYVRQSSPSQVLEHRESTARQYGFAEQAVAFGWPRERVLIIDEDLGKSGRTAEGRSGFQRLISEVTLNHVGMVCGHCGRRMQTLYHAHGKAQYNCHHRELTGHAPRCPGLAARVVDDLVTQQVLRALEPAAVELSMRAQADVKRR